MIENTIARINELYHKSQKEGLTPEEKEEQAALRKEYIASVKRNLKGQLDNKHKIVSFIIPLGKKLLYCLFLKKVFKKEQLFPGCVEKKWTFVKSIVQMIFRKGIFM